MSSIFCCNCRTNHDDSDSDERHNPNAKARDHNAVNMKRPAFPSKEAEQRSQNARVTFSAGATEGKRAGLTKSDTFSEYIHRAKKKIRTMSHVGTMKNDSEVVVEPHVHDTKKEGESRDTFSDYINRAKMKIRKTTSSIGNK